MTTILGLQKKDYCLLIADSRVTDDDGRTYTHPVMQKITKRGKFLIAGAGLTQPCDIIQHNWIPPTPNSAAYKNLYHYMISMVIPSMRVALTVNGYMPDKESEDSDFIFLIALGGMIFEIDDSLSVLMREDGIYGIGSGSPYAIGALHAGTTWKHAMNIAAKNNVFTAPPFITHKQVSSKLEKQNKNKEK
jgi:ATP-dependent protease HslVU (ClpYQ) peptidase subunit